MNARAENPAWDPGNKTKGQGEDYLSLSKGLFQTFDPSSIKWVDLLGSLSIKEEVCLMLTQQHVYQWNNTEKISMPPVQG